MKRVLMMILMAGFVSAANAQEHRRGPNPEERMEKAKEHLGLSDEQFEQWKEVHEKYKDEVQAIQKEREQQSEKGQALKEKIDSELVEILTDEQKEKFAELQKRGGKGRKPGGRKPGGED